MQLGLVLIHRSLQCQLRKRKKEWHAIALQHEDRTAGTEQHKTNTVANKQ